MTRISPGAMCLIAGGLCAPGMAADLPPANTGSFYVSNYSADNVVVYADDGTYLRSFTTEGLNGPRGIVVHPETGDIYVAGQNSPGGIYVFDAGEHFQYMFTDAELVSATGMALSPDGLLYVSSFSNDVVVVFELDGTKLRSFTGGGLNAPNCVAFDAAGYIYVASAATDEVIKFDPQENYIESFSWQGAWGNSPDSAMGIARDDQDNLYVAGGNSHDIIKFSSSGELLERITHPDLTGPQGVAFDDRGHMFSSSFYQDNVVEFDTELSYVQTITSGNLAIPRSIAFVRTTAGDVNDDGVVDVNDLLSLLASWGPCADCPQDVNGDNVVNIMDLLVLLANWG